LPSIYYLVFKEQSLNSERITSFKTEQNKSARIISLERR
jgi:hypothetical protein